MSTTIEVYNSKSLKLLFNVQVNSSDSISHVKKAIYSKS